MRQEILLGRHAVPKRVRLPDGTSFVARYKRISRKNLNKKHKNNKIKNDQTEK